MENPESTEHLARQVRMALEASDLASFSDLLAANVHWGPPGDPWSPCQNREQVLDWYARGKASGATATVSEVTVLGDQLLVGLVVRGTSEAQDRGGRALRWQLLTVHDGLVSEIVGFQSRNEAEAYAAASRSFRQTFHVS